jgi:hypothetical protein
MQIEAIASAVNGKLQNDLEDFKQSYEGSGEELVAPPNPEVFCSGTIINGFTPMNKRETDTLCNSIKLFGVKVVLVIDYEKLEKDIVTFLKQNKLDDV